MKKNRPSFLSKSRLGTAPKRSGLGWALLAMLAASLSGAGFVSAQKLSVRTERAPFFVGTPIALEVDAIDFDSEPKIKVAGDDQESVNLKFRNTGRSESTQIFQSGGKLIRNRVVKTTFYYQLSFDDPGKYTIGPFETELNGKTVTHPAIEYEVKDIEVTNQMRVEIEIPQKNIFPGQQVPVTIRWLFAGDPRLVRGLTIRNPLFDRFRFIDSPAQGRSDSLPITTAKGVISLPAKFQRETISGIDYLVGTAKRTMVPDKPEKVKLPPTVVYFQKITGRSSRGDDIFGSFFDSQPNTMPMKGVGESVEFEVKPFPAENRPSSFQGTVGQDFKIESSLNRSDIRTGDPLTLQINISGDGNIDSASIPKLDGVFSRDDFEWPDGEVAGVTAEKQKQFRVLLKVKNEQVTEIPPLEFSWFDPVEEKYVTAFSEPIPVKVKKGVVVSSDDVIRVDSPAGLDQAKGLSDVREIDLSIQTDVDELLAPGKNGGLVTWILYASGLVIFLGSLLLQPLKAKGTKDRIQKRSTATCCKAILGINPGPDSIDRLANQLRRFQALLNEEEPERNRQDFYQKLDQLIGRCDDLAYRQNTPTPGEQEQLFETARQLVKQWQSNG